MSKEREALVTSDAFALGVIDSFIEKRARMTREPLLSMLRLFSEQKSENDSLYVAKEGGFGSDVAKLTIENGDLFLEGLKKRGIIENGFICGYIDDRVNTEEMLRGEEFMSKRTAVSYIAPMMSEFFKRKALKKSGNSLKRPIGDEGFEVIIDSIDRNQVIIDSTVVDIISNPDRFYQGPNFPLLVLLAHGAINFHLSRDTTGGTSMEKWLAIDFPVTIGSGNFIKSIIMSTNGSIEGYVEEMRAFTDPLEGFNPLV